MQSVQSYYQTAPGVSGEYWHHQVSLAEKMRKIVEQSRDRLEITESEKGQFAEIEVLNLSDIALPLQLMLEIIRTCPNLQKIVVDDDAFIISDTLAEAFAKVFTLGKHAGVVDLLRPIQVIIDSKSYKETYWLRDKFREKLLQHLREVKPNELFALLEFVSTYFPECQQELFAKLRAERWNFLPQFSSDQATKLLLILTEQNRYLFDFFNFCPSELLQKVLIKLTENECELFSKLSADQFAKLLIILADQKWSFFAPETCNGLIYRLYEMQENGSKKIYEMDLDLLHKLSQALFSIASYSARLLLKVSEDLQARQRYNSAIHKPSQATFSQGAGS